MPRIPNALVESVVFLYPTEASAREGRPSGGTGFFVAVRSEATGRRFTYLITNLHVGCRDCVARGNTDAGVDVLPILAKSWVPHPDGDDVVATAVEIPDGWRTTAYEWGDIGPTADRMKELNVGIGDDTVMLGRYVGHEGQETNQPVARFGNIALMPGEPVLDGRGMRVEAYLVEMRSLPGYSGSPVFVLIGPASYRGEGKMMPFYTESIGLIGIDTGHKLESAPIYVKGSKDKIDQPWEVRQNSGVAIVAPFWKVSDVLEEFVEQRKKDDQEWLARHEGELASSDAVGPDGEFDRFADLTRKLLQTPKSEIDEKRKKN